MPYETIIRTLAPILTVEEKERSSWEYQFIRVMWDQRMTFDRKIIFEDNYQVEYRYHHDYKDKYMIFKFGKLQAKVTQNFRPDIEENIFPTAIIINMINEAKDIADNEAKLPKVYDLKTRAILWKRLSKPFFKCLYMHEEDIRADIANFTQLNL